jgi:glycerol uptake facilitator-like aquaporin
MKPRVYIWNAFNIEVICTSVLVMLVLVTKTARLAPSKSGFLALIGVVFTILGLTQVGGYSGACFNPAVALAQTFY